MSKAMRESLVMLGPCKVPTFTARAFSRWPKEIRVEDVWKLVGPLVEELQLKTPLWQIFCCAYLEGLQHGAAAAKEGI